MKASVVSVGIIAFNAEKYIERAIRSVLNQTFTDWEIIFVDDGSTDRTVELVEAMNIDSIRIIKNHMNRGVSYSRGVYVLEAEGKYIAVLDADDVWLPNKLAVQVGLMEQNSKLVVCGATANKVFLDHIEKWSYAADFEGIKLRFIWGNAAIHSSVLMRSDILKIHGLNYDKSLNQAEDYRLYTELIKHGEMMNYDDALIEYYVHENQLTSTKKSEQVDDAILTGYNFLVGLGIPLSQAFVTAYGKVFSYAFQLNANEFKELICGFVTIIDWNRRESYFEVAGLKKILMRKANMAFYESKGLRKAECLLLLEFVSRMKTGRIEAATISVWKCMLKKILKSCL